MGAKLVAYYDKAYQLGRLKAKMRLAVLTSIPSAKAATEPDSPENIQKFEAALKKIQSEF